VERVMYETRATDVSSEGKQLDLDTNELKRLRKDGRVSGTWLVAVLPTPNNLPTRTSKPVGSCAAQSGRPSSERPEDPRRQVGGGKSPELLQAQGTARAHTTFWSW
jgi:hypothetical protein